MDRDLQRIRDTDTKMTRKGRSGVAMKTVCISQARMGSTRLPGKVLLPIHGQPMLFYHLRRLQLAAEVDTVAVATTHLLEDDAIERIAVSLGAPCHRGPIDDVLTRFFECALRHQPDIVVRVTADCPLIDPGLVDFAVRSLKDAPPEIQYMNLNLSHFPRGLDVEVMRFAALAQAFEEAKDPYEREHVTPFLYRNPDRFGWRQLAKDTPAAQYRWCVDEQSDLDLISAMLERLPDGKLDFTWRDCVALMEKDNQLARINAGVAQKPSFRSGG